MSPKLLLEFMWTISSHCHLNISHDEFPVQIQFHCIYFSVIIRLDWSGVHLLFMYNFIDECQVYSCWPWKQTLSVESKMHMINLDVELMVFLHDKEHYTRNFVISVHHSLSFFEMKICSIDFTEKLDVFNDYVNCCDFPHCHCIIVIDLSVLCSSIFFFPSFLVFPFARWLVAMLVFYAIFFLSSSRRKKWWIKPNFFINRGSVMIYAQH